MHPSGAPLLPAVSQATQHGLGDERAENRAGVLARPDTRAQSAEGVSAQLRQTAQGRVDGRYVASRRTQLPVENKYM